MNGCATVDYKGENKYLHKQLVKDSIRIEQLEKENADLKCECRRCVYTDSPCVLSDYGKDRNGICDHFKDVFDEIAELKEDSTEWEKASDKWKAVYELTNNQLAKAKEIINELNEGLDKLYLSGLSTKQIAFIEQLQEKAEQFLKECK